MISRISELQRDFGHFWSGGICLFLLCSAAEVPQLDVTNNWSGTLAGESV
jgi:hypothetical protein